MKNFAIIGAAGYVAPRHLRAIRETGNQLIAALDRNDSVGIIDSYFPEADFFVEFERFDRHLEKLKRSGTSMDYLTVCSPNYLHDSHIRFGLRHNAHVICEKPLVLNPWNVEALQELESETGRRVFTILQLRLHPNIIAFRNRYASPRQEKVEVDLTYITSRGNWYYTSWKGDEGKSGGIATNIGIHFFDMLLWLFGKPLANDVHVQTHDRASGVLELERARVRWFLSINYDTLPQEIKDKGQRTYRSIMVGDEEIEFSEGFTDLHTESYKRILAGEGFGLDDALPSIRLVREIRAMKPSGLTGEHHPFAEKPLSSHPFEESRSELNQ